MQRDDPEMVAHIEGRVFSQERLVERLVAKLSRHQSPPPDLAADVIPTVPDTRAKGSFIDLTGVLWERDQVNVNRLVPDPEWTYAQRRY